MIQHKPFNSNRDYRCVIYFNRDSDKTIQGKERLTISDIGKITQNALWREDFGKKNVFILDTKIYYSNIQETLALVRALIWSVLFFALWKTNKQTDRQTKQQFFIIMIKSSARHCILFINHDFRLHLYINQVAAV